jgi:hypothetical protein
LDRRVRAGLAPPVGLRFDDLLVAALFLTSGQLAQGRSTTQAVDLAKFGSEAAVRHWGEHMFVISRLLAGTELIAHRLGPLFGNATIDL